MAKIVFTKIQFAKNSLNFCNNCQNMVNYKSKLNISQACSGGTLLKDRLNDYKLPIFMGSFFVRF